MEPYNYLRKASAHLRENVGFARSKYPMFAEKTLELLDECTKAQKFILPEGGRIFDSTLRCLPKDLRLPYPEIVLEYHCSGDNGLVESMYGDKCMAAPKRITYAQQVEGGGWIDVMAICGTPDGGWAPMPYIASIATVSEDQSAAMLEGDPWAEKFRGRMSSSVGVMYLPLGEQIPASDTLEQWTSRARADMCDEVSAVLGLIEALACSNVEHSVIHARKNNKGARRRGALPFDEYRTLLIRVGKHQRHEGDGAGEHRSPREHLRRGHIRRLPDRQIWVNSCVVNSGAGGVVEKGYKVAA
jgi:hypothetical protein